MPTSVFGSECETSTSITYLQDFESTCNQVLQNLAVECQSNLYLNAQEYLSFLVITNPSQLYQVYYLFFYYCFIHWRELNFYVVCACSVESFRIFRKINKVQEHVQNAQHL